VRIHTTPTADQYARAIKARAFTYQKNIAFAHGEYQPGTIRGRKLMAHELAHVMQQGDGAQGTIQRTPGNREGTDNGPCDNATGSYDTATGKYTIASGDGLGGIARRLNG
jgi:hypothetical protein